MAESPARTKMLAGLALMCVQTTVGVLYKISQAASGGFHYSTMSAVAIAECVKLCMSTSFHVADKLHHVEGSSKIGTAWASARAQLPAASVLHIMSLSFLYTINNQLSFYVYTLADPGTVFLFKAASTMIVAGIQVCCVGKSFSFEQWKAMMLQAIGMVIVQHDPCKGGERYPLLAYALMSVSAILTSLCAVRNEHLVKNFKITLHVQNAVLYAGGFGMNLMAFALLPNPNNSQASMGFFEGFDNPLVIAVVVANSLIGIAITAVYKYADAITKCISSDCTAVVLCIISSIFFELKASLPMWCGVLVVCFAVHSYATAPSAAPSPPPKGGGLSRDEASASSARSVAFSDATKRKARSPPESDDDDDETRTTLGKPTK